MCYLKASWWALQFTVEGHCCLALSRLEDVSGFCETAKCNMEACRSSIKDIYKYLLDTDQELALKIALCVCR